MKQLITPFLFLFLLQFTCKSNIPEQGFAFENSISGVTIPYKKHKNLIILSPRINDCIQVNLILDTGCRNVLLFGKKFEKYFSPFMTRPVVFSGLGEGKSIKGRMSLGNEFTMDGIIGRNIVVVVVPKSHAISSLENIDGFIGFDLLLKFEIEVNPVESTITFMRASNRPYRPGFKEFLIQTHDAVPEISAELKLGEEIIKLPLLIDTGSSLGLLYKTVQCKVEDHQVIGRGFNGFIFGEVSTCEKLIINGFELASNLPMTVARSKFKSCSSIGMRFLKDFIFVFNYPKGYFLLKPITNPDRTINPSYVTL